MEGTSVFDSVALEVGLLHGAITLRNLQILYWLRSQHPLTRPDMVRAHRRQAARLRQHGIAGERACLISVGGGTHTSGRRTPHRVFTL